MLSSAPFFLACLMWYWCLGDVIVVARRIPTQVAGQGECYNDCTRHVRHGATTVSCNQQHGYARYTPVFLFGEVPRCGVTLWYMESCGTICRVQPARRLKTCALLFYLYSVNSGHFQTECQVLKSGVKKQGSDRTGGNVSTSQVSGSGVVHNKRGTASRNGDM